MALNLHSHFGVYAVITQANKILLIRKARGPYLGLLDLPGGSPELHELLEETLSREVQEETGCALASSKQLGAVSAHYDYFTNGLPARLRHLGVLYHCTISGTPRQIGDGEDSDGCVWQAFNNLNSAHATPFVNLALEKLGA